LAVIHRLRFFTERIAARRFRRHPGQDTKALDSILDDSIVLIK